MDEYIKRATVTNHLDACMDTIWKPEIVALKCFVEGIPAADVAPVRHGRWEEADWIEPDDRGFELIRTPKAAWRCSECRNCFKKELLWKNNYCPNCGAHMKKEDKSDG